MKNEKNDKVWWEPALAMFAKVSIWVAVPVILALVVGRYLDNRYGTSPWIFLISTGIGFVISMVAIGKIAMDYIHKIEKPASHASQGDAGGENKEKNGDGK